ncbi:hypothetical protein M3182_03475 [Mesobacillus maritimus]|uniref:hypothetical protein n=1 Tax=Mesobacillus maritimus TaxID=1643336 RepID=UPI00203D5CAB|nr:hypothetical protein [Mesobacillus maritimus]MCM3584804.1 hypothetical protein [Mesobacillus maritimus]
MIKNKIALIGSVVLFIICMCLFFPFPDNHMRGIRSSFMTFPIRNEEGYIPLGIIGSFLFIVAIFLLVISLAKYRFRTVVLSISAYSILPMALIIMYQETVANGIFAISYNGQGKCNFESVSEHILNGECDIVLHNRSNEDRGTGTMSHNTKGEGFHPST